MSILAVKDMSFNMAGEQLYQDTNFRLFDKEHACLVGPNGSGKTTLLKLLNRAFKPDRGRVEWQNNKKIGYLDQYKEIPGETPVKHYLYEVFWALFEKENRMERLYAEAASASPEDMEKKLNQAAVLSEDLLENDFYDLKSRIGKILTGLGLDVSILDDPIRTLSDGMRAKIILAKLLLEEADVLLLDEPTNFLDIKHIDWLTKFLNAYEKAFIVVSHHEDFLRSVAQTVFAIENKEIIRYKGDYRYYLTERALRQEQHAKAFVAQQKFIDRTETFIQKNITRAKTSKRAQSRRKMLEKINKLAPPRKDKTYQFNFPLSKPTGREVLKVKALSIGYETELVEPLDFIIRKQEKVVITGKNGIGKSTLVKTMLGLMPELSGDYSWIDTAQIAYFSQDSNLDETKTPFETIHDAYPHFTKKDVMDLLAQHGIDYTMANRPLMTLSGGENAKVRLSLLKHQKGNVLILDEPTNHLDKEAKRALKEALNRYEGTMILVSHEASFYRGICDYAIELYA